MNYSATDCFEVMWASTEELELAGQEVRVPSKELGILILALHALRSPRLPARQKELEFLADLARRQSHTFAVLEFATSTGSLAAMRHFLEDLHVEPPALGWPHQSREWRNRLLATEPGSARLIAIVQATWQHKLKMLWRAVFPPPEAFLSTNIYADMFMLGRIRQQRARWSRFLRAAPQIVRDLKCPRN